MKKREILNNNGMALLTVILVFLVLTVLMSGTLAMTNANLKNSVVTKNHTAAFYASEAGLTKVSSDFETELDYLVNQTPSLSATAFLAAVNSYIASNASETINLSNNNGESSYADVNMDYVEIDSDGFHIFTITSEGYIGDIKRTLVKTYAFKYTEGVNGNGFVIDKAILTSGVLNLGQATVHDGPVSTYLNAPGSIRIHNGGSAPEVQIPTGSDPKSIITFPIPNKSTWESKLGDFITEGSSGISELESMPAFPALIMPTIPVSNNRLQKLVVRTPDGWNSAVLIDDNGNFKKDNSTWVFGTHEVYTGNGQNRRIVSNYTYTIPETSSTYYVPEFIIKGNEYLTINVGNTNKVFIVDKLILEGNFNVVGNGTLTIYVKPNLNANKNSLSFGYTSSIPVGNVLHPHKFIIYVYDQKVSGNNFEVEIGGSASYHMALMASNLNFKFVGSGSVTGFVVTGGNSIVINGGSSTSVALFYAPNATVSMGGGGSVYGSIMAQTFEANGGPDVYYRDIGYENIPFAVLDPMTGGTGGGAPILELKKGSTIEQ